MYFAENLTCPMAKSTKPYWEIRNSGIHNTGMFATRNIPEGTAIIEYFGERISKKESNKRCLEWEEKARKKGEGLVYIFDLNSKWDLDGNIEDNPAKFINHSCQENCEAVNDDDRIWIYSKKDIKKGEELSFDYGYNLEHFMDHPCRCGAVNCCGYIVAKEYRRKLRKVLKTKLRKEAEKKKKADLKRTKKTGLKKSKKARKVKGKKASQRQ